MGKKKKKTIREQAVEMERPLEEADRMVVNLTVHHETFGENPTAATILQSRILKTKGQPYVRRMKIGTEWAPLDTGWVETPGLVIIENRTGASQVIRATEEEQAKWDKMIVEIDADLGNGRDGFIQIEQSLFFVGLFKDASKVKIRSAFGSIPINIHVFPK